MKKFDILIVAATISALCLGIAMGIPYHLHSILYLSNAATLNIVANFSIDVSAVMPLRNRKSQHSRWARNATLATIIHGTFQTVAAGWQRDY